MNKFDKRLALLCGGAIMLTASAAHAQQVDDIVVTAQKRTERLQDVPIAITAVTSDLATAQGIRGSADLAVAVPGLNVVRQSTAVLFFMRGVGTTGAQAMQDSAIATFVDNVYQPSMSGATFSLNNIERIEVLKGPQGTLYGRNATGGAVNVITRKPSHDTSLQAEIGYGNNKTIEGNLYATTGLAENVAADVAFFYSGMGDGFGKNVITGAEVNKRKDIAVRSKLLFEPADGTSVTLAGDYSKTSGNLGNSFRPTDTSSLLNGQQGYPYGFWDTQANQDPYLYVKNWGGSLHIQHEADFATLTSITALRRLSVYQNGDLDMIDLPILQFESFEFNRQWTQELQLASNADSNVQWVLGGFYLNTRAGLNPQHLMGPAIFAPFDGFRAYPTQRTESFAIFGQTTIPIMTDTNLTLGGRYTIDKRKLKATGVLEVPGGGTVEMFPPVDRHQTFKEPTWRIALDHKLNPDVMLYASYSRGFKSGVYNSSSPTDPIVRPETLDAFELGVKSDLMDRRLRVNVAGFYYLYDDIQLQRVLGTVTVLVNAAKAEIYGLDFEFDAAITEQLTLRGGGEVQHARYTSFPGAPVAVPGPAGNIISVGDATGNKLVYTPDWQANVSLDHRMPVAGGELGTSISYAYNDGYYGEPDNRPRQKAYHMVNGQLRWTPENERFSIRLWARNLLNEKYKVQMTEVFTGDLVTPGAGREYGISLGIKM